MNHLIIMIAMLMTIILMPVAVAMAQQAVVQSASPTIPEVRPPTINPAVLLGKWQGEIVGETSGTSFFVTFTKVEGDSVEGVFYIHAPWVKNSRYSNRDMPFFGTIDGNRIRIPGLPTFDLELVGSKIEGEWKTDRVEFQGKIRDLKKKG